MTTDTQDVAAQAEVGRARVRKEDARLVTGQTNWTDNMVLPGMLYMAFARSPHAHARIVKIDTSKAAALPGVRAIVTAADFPDIANEEAFVGEGPMNFRDLSRNCMARDKVLYDGHAVAAVAANSPSIAEEAIELIEVQYEVLPHVIDVEEAMANGAPLLHDDMFTQGVEPKPTKPSNVAKKITFTKGDIAKGFAEAEVVIERKYTTKPVHQAYIEPHACVVAVGADDQTTIWSSSQGQFMVRAYCAKLLGVDIANIRAMPAEIGGGFGGKTLWSHHVLGAAASKLAGRPVRVTLSREGVYRLVGGRTNTEQRVAIGADDDGRFTALIHTGISAMTPYNALAEQFTFPARHMYATETLKTDQQVVDLDMLANSFMRAPGESVGTFALESAIDELAIELDLDPIELRIRNEPEKDPSSGLPFSARHLIDAWRAGAERFGWEQRAAPGTRREGEWLIGMGCATATYPYHRFPGGAARIRLDKTGHATVEVPANDMGMGTSTTQTIVTAERLGLPLERVTVAYGDSSFPGSLLAGGSGQTASIIGAVIAAQRSLVEQLLALAGDESPLAGLTADEVGGRDEGLCELADPSRWESYAAILRRAGRDELAVVASAADPEETETWSMHSTGAVFCEVRVNTVTGETRVDRVLGSYDCGRIINPKTADSQFRGGIIMGIGLALMEETEFDERTARIMNPSLAEYHVPVHMDVPRIEVMWTDIPDPYAPAGARGIGEIGITGVAAAVANAIYNATGRRVRDLPITLDKVL